MSQFSIVFFKKNHCLLNLIFVFLEIYGKKQKNFKLEQKKLALKSRLLIIMMVHQAIQMMNLMKMIYLTGDLKVSEEDDEKFSFLYRYIIII